MSNPADVLWRVNAEYRKRLSQVMTYLNLLEQLVLIQDGDEQLRTLAALRYVLEELQALDEEHRAWRYKYFYESPDSKRMVQSGEAIQQALARFSRMRTQHERRLADLQSLLVHVQRPDPQITRVPNGDLWTMAEYAINNLSGFGDYMQELTSV
jgi:ribosomal protein S21